jgi:hypothetical protein
VSARAVIAAALILWCWTGAVNREWRSTALPRSLLTQFYNGCLRLENRVSAGSAAIMGVKF